MYLGTTVPLGGTRIQEEARGGDNEVNETFWADRRVSSANAFDSSCVPTSNQCTDAPPPPMEHHCASIVEPAHHRAEGTFHQVQVWQTKIKVNWRCLLVLRVTTLRQHLGTSSTSSGLPSNARFSVAKTPRRRGMTRKTGAGGVCFYPDSSFRV